MTPALGKSRGYERRSAALLFHLPLLHVVGGRDPFTGRRRMACGIVAVGQFAVGVISVCQFGAGVVALTQFGAGALFGLGQFVIAPAAVAQFAGGVLAAVGQFACAWLALGQMAIGHGNTVVGQSVATLGTGPAASLLWAPAVGGWLISVRVLRALGSRDERSRLAKELPATSVCNVAGLQPGAQVLRAKVSPDAGVLFDAADLTPVPAHRARVVRPEFLVEDEFGAVLVRADDAELFVAGRGDVVAIEAGDTLEIYGVVRQIPDAAGKQSDYRRPPTRYEMTAKAIAAHQTMATVRAMARLPGLLAWLMAVVAAATVALAAALSIAGRI